ncbi:hypothetical protein Tco_0864424 [Tanacetum coccineum]
MYHPHRASPPPSQSSPISAFNLDDDNFEPLWDFTSHPSQYTQYTKGPSEPVEDDSPVEEIAAVKPKRKYTRRRQPIKKNDKEFVESTSETTPQGNSDSAHIGLNLNDEAADSEDVERKELSSEYLRIKERELELEDEKIQEQGELERLKIAQRDKKIRAAKKMFEFQQQQNERSITMKIIKI